MVNPAKMDKEPVTLLVPVIGNTNFTLSLYFFFQKLTLNESCTGDSTETENCLPEICSDEPTPLDGDCSPEDENCNTVTGGLPPIEPGKKSLILSLKRKNLKRKIINDNPYHQLDLNH